jgi:hypothetical protein
MQPLILASCLSRGLLLPSPGSCSPASGVLAIASQLVATIHMRDPQNLQLAREFLSAAGFHCDEDVMAIVERGIEPGSICSDDVPCVTAPSSDFLSQLAHDHAAACHLPPSAMAYSHGMLAHFSARDSNNQVNLENFSEFNLSAAAPIRAAHPERPDRLRAAGETLTAPLMLASAATCCLF